MEEIDRYTNPKRQRGGLADGSLADASGSYGAELASHSRPLSATHSQHLRVITVPCAGRQPAAFARCRLRQA